MKFFAKIFFRRQAPLPISRNSQQLNIFFGGLFFLLSHSIRSGKGLRQQGFLFFVLFAKSFLILIKQPPTKKKP